MGERVGEREEGRREGGSESRREGGCEGRREREVEIGSEGRTEGGERGTEESACIYNKESIGPLLVDVGPDCLVPLLSLVSLPVSSAGTGCL